MLASLGPYREMLEPQRQHLLSLYRPIDVAFKVVGTGSVGLRDYCIYFEGNGPDDPLFLQIKEEAPSAYTPYLPERPPIPHNGQRVVDGQRAMQLQSDPFLGWTHIGARQFLVRQLNDHKGSIELTDLAGSGLVSALAKSAASCSPAVTPAPAIRSSSPAILAPARPSPKLSPNSASLYADQTEKDWQALRRSSKVDKK